MDLMESWDQPPKKQKNIIYKSKAKQSKTIQFPGQLYVGNTQR